MNVRRAPDGPDRVEPAPSTSRIRSRTRLLGLGIAALAVALPIMGFVVAMGSDACGSDSTAFLCKAAGQDAAVWIALAAGPGLGLLALACSTMGSVRPWWRRVGLLCLTGQLAAVVALVAIARMVN